MGFRLGIGSIDVGVPLLPLGFYGVGEPLPSCLGDQLDIGSRFATYCRSYLVRFNPEFINDCFTNPILEQYAF
jgi:hypothetical protein